MRCKDTIFETRDPHFLTVSEAASIAVAVYVAGWFSSLPKLCLKTSELWSVVSTVSQNYDRNSNTENNASHFPNVHRQNEELTG